MQRVNGKLQMMHGESAGRPLTATALPYRGGVFGQPSLPLNRLGIFKAKWALPWEDMVDNTIGPGHVILPDRYVMESGLPVRGIIPKKLAGEQFPQIEGTVRGPRKDLRGMGCMCGGGMGTVSGASGGMVLGAGAVALLLIGLVYFATRKG